MSRNAKGRQKVLDLKQGRLPIISNVDFEAAASDYQTSDKFNNKLLGS